MAVSEIHQQLRDAFVTEIGRQHSEGYKPGGRVTIEGFLPPDKGREDVVVILDGEIRVTPILVAVLEKLRDLPPAKLRWAIEEVLKAAPYY